MRVGVGVDFHRLVDGRKLILGGVIIPFEKGLLGHSDADVLSHAICDALLGAAALGDIGQHFPDTDDDYKNISSLILLQRTQQLLQEKNFSIGNIDATIIAEAPKLGPHFPAMKEKICEALHLEPHQLNLKATTSEGMGPTGRGEGVSAWAIVLLI